jgi:Sap, sulfolipid-1-addressing protein
MGSTLLQLLPLALAAALSSVTLTATVFILLSDRRIPSGLAFLAGTVIGTFAAITLATVAGQAIPGRQRHHNAVAGTLEIAIGAAFVLLGVITLARRNRAGAGRGRSWLDGVGSFGLVPLFGIGLALNLRPKAVLLVMAAGLAISRADLSLEDNLVLIIVYAAIATSTVVVPIVATILLPRWMELRLLAAKEWIASHSSAVSATIMILLGGFIIALGVAG